MSERHEIIRIFVASPGGLEAERRAIGDAVDEINRRNSSYWRLQFKAIGWEDTVAGNRRAQGIINRDLETCEYFFGILADHWGSPPQRDISNSPKYSSGFEEEYELAQKMYREKEMRDILLFFKEIPDTRTRDAGPSLAKVLKFRKKVRNNKEPLYTSFDDLDGFREKVGDALSKIGWSRSKEAPISEITKPVDVEATERTSFNEPLHTSDEPYLAQQTRDFLNDLCSRSGNYDSVTNVDTARLHLFSSSLSRAGNDELYLGAHDANLLYRSRSSLSLSEGEKKAFAVAGLKNFEHQNIPFWFWADGDVEQFKKFVQSKMVVGAEKSIETAFEIATVFGYEPLEFPGVEPRQFWIKHWLSAENSNQAKNAALVYLGRWGNDHDIIVMDEMRASNSGQVAHSIDCVAIEIMFRISQEFGLNELIKRDPEQISQSLRIVIKKVIDSLSSEWLEKIATLKSEFLRLESVKALNSRDALKVQLAEQLSGDNSIDVRFEAIKTLADKTGPIPDEQAKDALVKRNRSRGLGGLLGIGINPDDSSMYDYYKQHLLRRKTFEELVSDEAQESAHSADALLTLFSLFPRKTHKQLRKFLRDGFQGRFEAKLDEVKKIESPQVDEIVKKAEELKEFSCLQLTNRAIEILSLQMREDDLGLVRNVVDDFEIERSNSLLKYFFRFGTWEDIHRLLKLKTSYRNKGTSIHGMIKVETVPSLGAVLFKLGKNRLVDLLKLPEEVAVRTEIVKAATHTAISKLSNETILEFFNDEDDAFRKYLAIRCLGALPKRRIQSLLDRYAGRDQSRYYNVIFWLDLGVSMPKPFGQKIAQHELENSS